MLEGTEKPNIRSKNNKKTTKINKQTSPPPKKKQHKTPPPPTSLRKTNIIPHHNKSKIHTVLRVKSEKTSLKLGKDTSNELLLINKD